MALVDVAGSHQFTILGSTARTATPSVDTFRVGGASEITVVVECTAVTATPSVVFTLQGIDEVSSATWTLLASAAVTATGTTVLQVAPGLTAAANTHASELVPSAITMTAVHADADSITYSVTAHVS